MPLFITPDITRWSALTTSAHLITNIPNPSSEIPTRPGSYLFDPLRSNKYRSGGMYRIHAATNKGYVFAPNTKLYTNIGGADITNTITDADYTHAYDLCAEIETQLEANDASSTYTATFSDREKDGSSATFKFTITRDAGGTFELRGNDACYVSSILPSLGFNTSTDYTGASTYTSDHRACHTEEYICMTIPYNICVTSHQLYREFGNVGYFQFMGLLDSNLRFGYGIAYSNTAGHDGPKQMPKIFFYGDNNDAAVELDKPDSDFTESTDMYTFPDAVDSFPDYIGIDSQQYGGGYSATTFSGTSVYRHKMILMDMINWYGAANAIDYGWPVALVNPGGYNGNVQHIKIKVSDPRHPDGYCQLGTMCLGPGWYPSRATQMDWEYGMVDTHQPSFNSARQRRTNPKNAIYKTVDLKFRYMDDGDSTLGAGSDASWIEWHHRIFSRWLQDRETGEADARLPSLNTQSVGIGRQPFLYVDRAWNPTINREKRATGSTLNRQGYTPGSGYYTVAESGPWTGAGAASDYWHWVIKMVEEVDG